jgi:hypothetical protein
VARTILLVGTIAWLVAGGAGAALAALGTDRLMALLPPLAIDADAVGGALLTVALILVVLGCAHAAVLVGLSRGWRWAGSAGVLLGAVLCTACLALAAAALASGMREAPLASGLYVAAAAAAVAAIGYGLVAVRLTRELTSGSAS